MTAQRGLGGKSRLDTPSYLRIFPESGKFRV